MWRVAVDEGVLRLWSGATMTCTRAALMTIGQLSFYDQIKGLLLSSPYFGENVATHVTSSLLAVSFYFVYVFYTCLYIYKIIYILKYSPLFNVIHNSLHCQYIQFLLI